MLTMMENVVPLLPRDLGQLRSALKCLMTLMGCCSMISFEVRYSLMRDQVDDFIIVRSDGTPMYNFVVVVDDAL